MTQDQIAPRSRRAVLAAALGAAAASVASAFGRPREVAAVDNQPMIVGVPNSSTKDTQINSTGFLAFAVTSQGISISAVGTHTAVSGQGVGSEAQGLSGIASSSVGRGIGVQGDSRGNQGVGVFGGNYNNNIGVIGVSGANSNARPSDVIRPPKTGVFGWATQDSTARGVVGMSSTGQGVRGEATTGIGVMAVASGGGTALRVAGRASFDRSGTLTIPAGASSATKTGLTLLPSSMVIATVQENVSGVWVRAAVPSQVAGSITIRLNKAHSSPVKVAYFVLN